MIRDKRLCGRGIEISYRFTPLPEPLPPGAGEKRFLPLDGGGQVGVLNCYEIPMIDQRLLIVFTPVCI